MRWYYVYVVCVVHCCVDMDINIFCSTYEQNDLAQFYKREICAYGNGYRYMHTSTRTHKLYVFIYSCEYTHTFQHACVSFNTDIHVRCMEARTYLYTQQPTMVSIPLKISPNNWRLEWEHINVLHNGQNLP